MKIKFAALLLIILIQFIFIPPSKVFASHSRVDLLTADNFAVLAGTPDITDVPTSVITGDVGLSPATGAGIGVTCAEVTGTIYAVNAAGPAPCSVNNPGLLTTAKNDLTTAYNDAAGRTVTSTVGTELGGSTLTDGTYNSAAGTFGITGTLTLNGEGNANAVFIFKMATTLITASSSRVVLTNGAQACNVYWQVGSSATLGTSTSLVGNVLALTDITDNGSSTVNGRLLARNGEAILNKTTITKQTCAAASSTSSSSSSSSSGGNTTVYPNLNKYNVPIIIESSRVDSDSVFISWGPYSGISTFIVRYGLENGNWLYSTNVTGFSTTINYLPANQPIWVQIAVRDNNTIGTYGETKLVGGPRLPNTGFAPHKNNISWYIPTGIFVGIWVLLVLIRKKHRFSSGH